MYVIIYDGCAKEDPNAASHMDNVSACVIEEGSFVAIPNEAGTQVHANMIEWIEAVDMTATDTVTETDAICHSAHNRQCRNNQIELYVYIQIFLA